ncbi:Predicted transcriptional regulator [Sphingobacterium daejeonense]|jgi:putative transcriptional regulator|nr:Predicted transcriptional regulator [Sphingobacterium daejeonense]
MNDCFLECNNHVQNIFVMPIIVHLDDIMSQRKMSLNELSSKVGITLSNLSIIKNQKAKAIRISTLDAICKALACQPGDIFKYVED